MARMAAAYSFEKMRKALNELRNWMEAQKIRQSQNQTSNFRENANSPKSKEKRVNNLIEAEGITQSIVTLYYAYYALY